MKVFVEDNHSQVLTEDSCLLLCVSGNELSWISGTHPGRCAETIFSHEKISSSKRDPGPTRVTLFAWLKKEHSLIFYTPKLD